MFEADWLYNIKKKHPAKKPDVLQIVYFVMSLFLLSHFLKVLI